MALDPRLEILPEHQGPAYRTWQLIMQTTMGKVVQTPSSSGFQFQSAIKQAQPHQYTSKVPLVSAEDFISLDDAKKTPDNAEENCSSLKRKKSVSSEESLSSLEDEDVKSDKDIPWKGQKKYPENAYGLHLEIKDFFDYMTPSPQEENMRKDVVQRITNLITSIWPAAKVEVFGSFRTNLYLPTSDIDLSVFGKWENLPLHTLEKALISNNLAEPATIKVLDKATVPIVKLTDKKSKIRVDISFNTETSVKSAEMIKSYLKEFKILPYLFLTLKHFLVQRDLNEVFTGGISSYCLLLLTISFLQRHPRVDARKEKDVNLGVLLMEFFELYGRNFNYQRIGVKIKNGGCYVSKDEVAKELSNGEYPALLCIEDPVTLACDIGRSSYGILRVKEAFEYAFNVVDKALRNKFYFKINPESTYLSRIISIPSDLCTYRKWVGKLYANHVFIPTPAQSPVYHEVTYSNNNNVRPALLPTPPTYSPLLNQMKSPNYRPIGFFTNNQPIVLSNTSAENLSPNLSNQSAPVQNIQLPPNTKVVSTTSNVAMPTVGYIYCNNYSHSVDQQSYSHKSPQLHCTPYSQLTPSFPVIKTVNNNYCTKGMTYVNSSTLASSNHGDVACKTYTNSSYTQSRRNNGIFFKHKDDRRNSSRSSSKTNSPRVSPKLQSKEVTTLTEGFNGTADRHPVKELIVDKKFLNTEFPELPSFANKDQKKNKTCKMLPPNDTTRVTQDIPRVAEVPEASYQAETLSRDPSQDSFVIENSKSRTVDLTCSDNEISAPPIMVESSDDDATVGNVIAISSDAEEISSGGDL